MGKSTLLSNLAGVYSEVAAYEFTTLTTVPGCIKYKVNKYKMYAQEMPIAVEYNLIIDAFSVTKKFMNTLMLVKVQW